MDNQKILQQFIDSFQDNAIRSRSYYPEFRRRWEAVIRRAAESNEVYFDPASDSGFAGEHTCAGIETGFHFDQMKIAEWYQRDLKDKHVVFKPQKMKHDKQGLHFHEYTCSYDPNAAEPALNDENRNIIAAAMPELPARLQIVYGNKWVDGRFNAFLSPRFSRHLLKSVFTFSSWTTVL